MRGWSWCSMRRVRRAGRADMEGAGRLAYGRAEEAGCRTREPNRSDRRGLAMAYTCIARHLRWHIVLVVAQAQETRRFGTSSKCRKSGITAGDDRSWAGRPPAGDLPPRVQDAIRLRWLRAAHLVSIEGSSRSTPKGRISPIRSGWTETACSTRLTTGYTAAAFSYEDEMRSVDSGHD